MTDDIDAELAGIGKEMDKDAEIERKSRSHTLKKPTNSYRHPQRLQP
ncbi:hypothetical protein PtrM4_012750 [Pyrenophora tritici-repentis]|uniref:Uncharacterized protein n=1 Tax=Pyrenophora tritici-repentis TaxID=45151 RepID=A0A834S7I6_9PLEO|nr:hypothetical protein PtrM4_012750 [Pyrenophora tritici-repentis]